MTNDKFDEIVKCAFLGARDLALADLTKVTRAARVTMEVDGVRPGCRLEVPLRSSGPVLSAMWDRPIEAPADWPRWWDIASGAGSAAWRYVRDATECIREIGVPDIFIAKACPLGTLDTTTHYWVGQVELHFGLVIDGWKWRGGMNPNFFELRRRENWEQTT
jgi:hypothetical protein